MFPVAVILALSILVTPALAEPCQWFGTAKINGIDADSVIVTAHDPGTDEFLAGGWEIEEKGQYFIEIEEDNAGDYVKFMIMGAPVFEENQLCESGETKRMDLTAMKCTDCDNDGFVSLIWGGGDCDDRYAGINPDMREICGNGVDENCDGMDLACPNCDENWICSAWSECVNGEQSRGCVDESGCGTTKEKPAQAQVCYIYNAGIVCEDGEYTCAGDDLLMECFAGEWIQNEYCQFGCIDGACDTGGITGLLVSSPVTLYSMIIIILAVFASGIVYWRTRRF